MICIMKILVIAPTPYYSDRGTPIRIFEHITALKKCGHEIQIVSYGAGKDMGDVPIHRVKVKGVDDPDKFFTQAFGKRILIDCRMVFKVWSVKRKFKPDILLCYLQNGFLMAYLSSYFSAKKIVFDCHDLLIKALVEKGMIKNRVLKGFFSLLERAIFIVAPKIMVPSQAIKNKIESTYKFNHAKIEVIKDGASSAILDYKPNSDDLRKLRNELGVKADEKLVIYTGFINNIAGIDVLIRAAHLLRSRNVRNFKIAVAGFPDLEPYLALSRELGTEDIVKFLGKVDYSKMPLYLYSSDIAVAPKISEAEGNSKIIYYFAAGLPVVCFRTKTNVEIAESYANYADELTAESFANALKNVLDNLASIKNESNNRKKFARETYTWENIINIVENANKN